MKRAKWLDLLYALTGSVKPLTRPFRDALSALDDALFELWNFGENVILAWTCENAELHFLCVRHYALFETMQGEPVHSRTGGDAVALIDGVLAGNKHLAPQAFEQACRAFDCEPRVVKVHFHPGVEVDGELISNLVRRYGVSLVRGRAVVLLDAVKFSLHSPLEQMGMLNSLAFSVNSAYSQLLSKDIQVNFARTTTGDGFYIWNRASTVGANNALYKLMMMILADNAVAQRKARHAPVPKLRAAFHVGDHYEFHQMEALNPTTFSYIVGQVTIDLSRMIEKALPGQILLGDFNIDMGNGEGETAARFDTADFVENTAATLDQLKGLVVSGDYIDNIRCYLTGESAGNGRFSVNRYGIRDKHGTERSVYNAKINIHRQRAAPIYLGVQREELSAFPHTNTDILEPRISADQSVSQLTEKAAPWLTGSVRGKLVKDGGGMRK
jgi:hypothetical protein